MKLNICSKLHLCSAVCYGGTQSVLQNLPKKKKKKEIKPTPKFCPGSSLTPKRLSSELEQLPRGHSTASASLKGRVSALSKLPPRSACPACPALLPSASLVALSCSTGARPCPTSACPLSLSLAPAGLGFKCSQPCMLCLCSQKCTRVSVLVEAPTAL